MEMALTGELVGAERLERYGLVNRLVEPGEALPEAVRLARTIIGNAPMAVAASKAVIRRQRDWASAEEFEQQEAITGPVLRSADAREGAAAFTEKRVADWQGR